MLLFKILLAVGSPLLLLVLLEGGLRLVGYGRDYRYFVPDEQPGMLRSNPHFTEWFFPASFGLKPVNFRLPAQKPKDAVRIFVIGESAAMGVPEPAFGLTAQLRARLRSAFPGKTFEVYNLGVTAINSHAIVEIATQAVTLHPDLLVIYMGNNEFVGPFGASSVFGTGTLPRALARANVKLRGTRTGQLFLSVVARLARGARPSSDWRGMEMFAGRSVPPGDPQLGTVYANFAGNLEEILSAARRAGVKTVLSTVAVNVRDCAPFVSQHAHGLSDAQRQASASAEAEGSLASRMDDPSAAIAAFGRALAIDPGYAQTEFALARALEAAGEQAEADMHYLRALECDTLRFRADARINEIIRAAAAGHARDVRLVDAAQAMNPGGSPAGAGGHAWFFEHVHLTWEGNAVLSSLLARSAARALWGEKAESAPWPADDAVAAAVGFTVLGRQAQFMQMNGLTSRPPFTGQQTFAADRAWMQQRIAACSAELQDRDRLRQAVDAIVQAQHADPGNGALVFQAASARLTVGDPAGALALNDTLAELEPPSAELAVQRAYALIHLRRFAEAESLLLRWTEREPYYYQTYGMLAQLWVATGSVDKGRTFFSGAVKRMPESRAIRLPLARFHGLAGDHAAEEGQWLAVLRQVPDEESALKPLVDRYWSAGRRDEAVRLMLEAYAYNPRNYDNNARLLQYYGERGDHERIATFMAALADSGPVSGRLFTDLADELLTLNRPDEARAALIRARHAAEAEGDSELLAQVLERLSRGPAAR